MHIRAGGLAMIPAPAVQGGACAGGMGPDRFSGGETVR
jgi:hypothetical protein